MVKSVDNSGVNLEKEIRSKIHKREPNKPTPQKEGESLKRAKKPNGAGSIRQMKSGNFEGRVMVNGKSRSVSGKTVEDVQKKINMIVNPIGYLDTVNLEGITVEEWVNLWFELYGKDVKPSTLKRYEIDTRLRIVPIFGENRVADVRAIDLKRMYNSVADGGLSYKSIKNLHGTFHTILQAAVENDIIERNPADKVRLPKHAKQAKEAQFMEREEIKEFLRLIKDHPLRGLFFVAIFTGLREGELIGLTWDCVDWENHTIKVYRQLPKDLNHYDRIEFTTLKNGKSRVIVPPAEIFAVLENVKKEQEKNKGKAGKRWENKENFIFTNENGRHLSYQTVYRKFKKVAAEMGRPELRFHDLRHTYTTIAVESGADLKAVQENTGRATTEFMLNRYTHTTEKMLRDCADRIQDFITGE